MERSRSSDEDPPSERRHVSCGQVKRVAESLMVFRLRLNILTCSILIAFDYISNAGPSIAEHYK
jgi:hypothetical protein